MNTKSKTKNYIDHHTLVHLFAQNKRTNIISSSKKMWISDNGTSLYHDGVLIAKITHPRKKVVFIKSTEYTNWRYFITNAFFDFTIIYTSDINDKLYETAILYYIKDYIKNIGYFNRFLTTNARALYTNPTNTLYYYLDELNQYIDNIHTVFKPKSRFLNKVRRLYNLIPVYKGWSIDYYDNVGKTTSIKDLLENGIYSTRDIEVLKLKYWLWKHRDFYKLNKLSRINRVDIYNDINLRKQYEDEYKEILKERKKKEEAKALELEAKNKLKAKEDLKLWLSDEINEPTNAMMYLDNIHLKLKNDIVYTTKRANVPITHAERLFTYFKKCIADDKPFIANGKSIHVGQFKCTRIDKDTDSDWFMIIGCHILREKEINEFLTRYNLTWGN